jgi:hypothetical protein
MSSGCFDSALVPQAELARRSARQVEKSFLRLRHYLQLRAVPGLLYPESPSFILMNAPSCASTMLCSFTMPRMRGEGSAPLLFRAADHQSKSWDSLRCGGADPSVRANRIEKLCSLPGSLRIARRGVRWIADHDVCSGIQQLRKRLTMCFQ